MWPEELLFDNANADGVSGPGMPAAGRFVAAPAAGARRRATGMRVLLAEDDDDMRRLLVSALRAEGFAVRASRSGVELLHRIGSLLLSGKLETGIDLIISDVRMPGITGLRVLAGLRRGNWNVPLILITAFGDESIYAEARGLGAIVLDKPFELKQLIALARSVTARGL